MNNDILKKIKDIFLTQISDDYTDIGYVGILESEIPDLSSDKELEKQYILKAVGDLLAENKIRVGNLSNENSPFLHYWNVGDDEIIKRLDEEWVHYFGSNHWEYHQVPIFDLTEEYAKQIGKYQSDQEKFEKEKSDWYTEIDPVTKELKLKKRTD